MMRGLRLRGGFNRRISFVNLVVLLDIGDYNTEQRGMIFLRGGKLLDSQGQRFICGQHLAEFDENADDENVHLYVAGRC